MIFLWILAACAGLLLAVGAGQRAVHHATVLIRGTRIPPFFVGVTLVAIGTDLPEIANSIVSSAAGHGDLNVGDSIGSAVAQISLVLGLLPFFWRAFRIDRKLVIASGVATCACIGIGAMVVADGLLSRGEALLLLGAWMTSTAVVWRVQPRVAGAAGEAAAARAGHAVAALVSLGLVGVGSALAIKGMIEIASALSIPEYLISFFALSLGTSLPELVVDITALRRGHAALAIGDVFGSSLVDASLSISAGPLLFPNVVDADLAARGALVALAVVAFATLLLGATGRHGRVTGVLLLGAYASVYPLLIA